MLKKQEVEYVKDIKENYFILKFSAWLIMREDKSMRAF